MTAARGLLVLLVVGCGPAVPGNSGESGGDGTSVAGSGMEVPTTAAASTTSSVTTTGPGSSSGAMVTDSFVLMPDLYDDPIDCEVFAQDCEAGEKCVPTTDEDGFVAGTTCAPVLGEGLAGDPCTQVGVRAPGVDTCAFGHLCWDVDERGNGECFAMCTGDGGELVCAEGFDCVFGSDAGVLFLCKRSCDPLVQDCSPGEACVMEAYEFVCVPDTSGETGKANDVCVFWGDCDPGLACVASSYVSAACDGFEQSCCSPFCELPDGGCPNPDQGCVPWYGDSEFIPPGDEDIGVCAIPQ